MHLFLIQCSKSKGGTQELFPQPHSMIEGLPAEAAHLLTNARESVKRKFPDRFGLRQLTALSMYDGALYTSSLKQQIISNIGKFAVLIMSGGYGLLKPDETITEYDINIQKCARIWRTCLPAVLRAYVITAGISEISGIFSASGAYVRIARECKRFCVGTPFRIHIVNYQGPGAQKIVPQLQSKLFLPITRGELPTSIDGIPLRTLDS